MPPESLPTIGIIEARYSPPRLGTLELVGCTWLQQMDPTEPWRMAVCVARIRCRQGAMVYEDLPADLPLMVLEAMQMAIEEPAHWRLSEDWALHGVTAN